MKEINSYLDYKGVLFYKSQIFVIKYKIKIRRIYEYKLVSGSYEKDQGAGTE